MSGAEPPSWATWREALRVIATSHHLRRTVAIAVVVGSLLFSINQLDVVMRGDATAIVWIKTVVTYLVPFCVSNAGVLVASGGARRRPTRSKATYRLQEANPVTPGSPGWTRRPEMRP